MQAHRRGIGYNRRDVQEKPMSRLFVTFSLVLAASLTVAAEEEPDWQRDLAAAQRLARQTDRPIFAVLH
jgi:hypothetical protein